MKLNALALTTLLALAAADTTITAHATKGTLSPEASCANNCNSNDRCCVAACYKVPCPSESQAKDTNSCVAKCPQGNGSAADTQRYSNCEQACYSSHFFPATGEAAATSTGNGATATLTGTNATTTGSVSATGASHTGSTSTSSATGAMHTTNAASHVKLGASAAGLLGLVVVALAL